MTALYLITPPRIEPAGFADDLAAALDAGPVACVQLRLKDADEASWRAAIAALRPVVQSRGVAFLLNDRLDLARATGCDGVHLGQDDLPPGGVAEARRRLDDPNSGYLSLGVTCHDSRHLAMTAAEQGADYVAFGAFFPTGTKQPKTRADVDLLSWWSEIMEIPCVAIGGITAENCAPLVRAGADFLAVVAAVWQHPKGPAAGIRALHAAMASSPPRA